MTSPTPSPAGQQPPLFRAFEWADPKQFSPLPPAEVLPVISMIRDLSAGAALVMQIVERDTLAADDEDFQPIFGPVEHADLLRLAIVSMQFVARDAAGLLSDAYTHHTRPPDTAAGAGAADHSP